MKKFVLLSTLVFGCLTLIQAQLPWPAESPSPDDYGYTWKTDSATGRARF